MITHMIQHLFWYGVRRERPDDTKFIFKEPFFEDEAITELGP
jgi:hypothetical protein